MASHCTSLISLTLVDYLSPSQLHLGQVLGRGRAQDEDDEDFDWGTYGPLQGRVQPRGSASKSRRSGQQSGQVTNFRQCRPHPMYDKAIEGAGDALPLMTQLKRLDLKHSGIASHSPENFHITKLTSLTGLQDLSLHRLGYWEVDLLGSLPGLTSLVCSQLDAYQGVSNLTDVLRTHLTQLQRLCIPKLSDNVKFGMSAGDVLELTRAFPASLKHIQLPALYTGAREPGHTPSEISLLQNLPEIARHLAGRGGYRDTRGRPASVEIQLAAHSSVVSLRPVGSGPLAPYLAALQPLSAAQISSEPQISQITETSPCSCGSQPRLKISRVDFSTNMRDYDCAELDGPALQALATAVPNLVSLEIICTISGMPTVLPTIAQLKCLQSLHLHPWASPDASLTQQRLDILLSGLPLLSELRLQRWAVAYMQPWREGCVTSHRLKVLEVHDAEHINVGALHYLLHAAPQLVLLDVNGRYDEGAADDSKDLIDLDIGLELDHYHQSDGSKAPDPSVIKHNTADVDAKHSYAQVHPSAGSEIHIWLGPTADVAQPRVLADVAVKLADISNRQVLSQVKRGRVRTLGLHFESLWGHTLVDWVRAALSPARASALGGGIRELVLARAGVLDAEVAAEVISALPRLWSLELRHGSSLAVDQ